MDADGVAFLAFGVAFLLGGVAALLDGVALLHSPELPRRLAAWLAKRDASPVTADARTGSELAPDSSRSTKRSAGRHQSYGKDQVRPSTTRTVPTKTTAIPTRAMPIALKISDPRVRACRR